MERPRDLLAPRDFSASQAAVIRKTRLVKRSRSRVAAPISGLSAPRMTPVLRAAATMEFARRQNLAHLTNLEAIAQVMLIARRGAVSTGSASLLASATTRLVQLALSATLATTASPIAASILHAPKQNSVLPRVILAPPV